MSRGLSLSGAGVLVTGGAGGLARALAPELIRRGARVALLDLDGDAAVAAAAVLGSDSVARGFACDVRDEASVQAAVSEAAAFLGRLDVVVAAAGVDLLRPFEALTDDDWLRVLDINLHGVRRTFRAALPHVPSTGYLLAVASMASYIHSPLHSAYVASKAAVLAMCDSLRLELRPDGRRVGSLHPTFFASPMTEVTLKGTTAWSGNAGLLWGLVEIDDVVTETVRAIEKRSNRVTVPRRLAPVALAPGAFRVIVDRIGFRDRDIRTALRRTSD